MKTKRYFFHIYRSLIIFFSVILFTGCSLRQLPPVKYVPKLGQNRSVSTVEVLSRALEDEDILVRAQAVQLLGAIYRESPEQERKHITKILGKASQDSDPGIRLQSIEILGVIEPRYSNRYLQKALKDTNPLVREHVMQVLANRHNGKED
jgi:hypothetical protein